MMPGKLIGEMIERQRFWLDPLGDALGNLISRWKATGGDNATQVLDFLHGVWLEHPQHPALTDATIGAWTVGFLADALDAAAPSENLKQCADGSIALGVISGLGTAATGLADWHHLGGRSRRLGLMHGVLNLSALSLYTAALALRCAKRRSAGRNLAMVAYGVASVSAYLGGELVFGAGVGVNRGAWERPAKDFVAVLPEGELEENTPRRVTANGASVVLVRRYGRIHALAETCSHLGGPLSQAHLKEGTIVCPWHGSQFALDDGRVVHGPATFPQTAYDVRVKDGQIEVRGRG
ncbi:MAG: Rieske 2Fe-2S domain-containing protein [Chloroflexi bacterium]|nr:Rieske 2Fe-2S domain-containing protein [Chloroflexota bacterium]